MKHIEKLITEAIRLGIKEALFEAKKQEDEEPKQIGKWFEKYFTKGSTTSTVGSAPIEMTYWQANDGGYKCHYFKEGEYTVEMRMIFKHKMKKCVSVDGLPIGFSEDEQKWYGWTHRGCCGFGIGDTSRECYPGATKKGKKCKTLNDCKKAAIAFAKSVS